MENISKKLFYMAYDLLIFETFFSVLPVVQNYKVVISGMECVILLFCILFQLVLNNKKIKFNTLLFIIVATVVSLLSYLVTRSSDLVLITLFIISSVSINFTDFIKHDLKMKVCNLFFFFLLLASGVILNTQIYRIDGTIRNTLGFSSPNTLGIILLNITCDYIWIHRGKIGLRFYIFIIVEILILLFLTNSRTSSLCLILLLVILMFKKYVPLKKLKTIPVLFLFISFVCMFLYDKNIDIIYKMDNVLSTRIYCGYMFFNEYGISLLGNKFRNVTEWIGYNYTLDNSYLNLVIHHGIIMTVFFEYLLIKIINNAEKKDELVIRIIFFVYLVCGLFESNLITIVYNPFLLYYGYILYKNGRDKNEKVKI